jgi:hypothetical protein
VCLGARVPWGVRDSSPAGACGEHAIRGRIALERGIIVRDCQEYLSWLCAMMHEMHHSVLFSAAVLRRVWHTPNKFTDL